MTTQSLGASAVALGVAGRASAMAFELTDMPLDMATAAASTAAGFDLTLSGGGTALHAGDDVAVAFARLDLVSAP